MTKIIVSFLLLAAAVGLFLGYVRPLYDASTELSARVESYDQALEKTREIQELKRSLLARYNIFSGANLDRLQKLLPDHVDNVRLVLDLDGIASEHGMRIQNVAVQSSQETDGTNSSTVLGALDTQSRDYQSLVLQFDVTASYEDFVRFMQDIESSLRIVDLVGLSLEKSSSFVDANDGSARSVAGLYDFSVGIRTYWLKQE